MRKVFESESSRKLVVFLVISDYLHLFVMNVQWILRTDSDASNTERRSVTERQFKSVLKLNGRRHERPEPENSKF